MRCVSDAFVESWLNRDVPFQSFNIVGDRLESKLSEHVCSAVAAFDTRAITLGKKLQGWGPFVLPFENSDKSHDQGKTDAYWTALRSRRLKMRHVETIFNFNPLVPQADDNDPRGFVCTILQAPGGQRIYTPFGSTITLNDTIAAWNKLNGVPIPASANVHEIITPRPGGGVDGDCGPTEYISGSSDPRAVFPANELMPPYGPEYCCGDPNNGSYRAEWQLQNSGSPFAWLANVHETYYLMEDNPLGDTLKLCMDTAQEDTPDNPGVPFRFNSIPWNRRADYIFKENLNDFPEIPGDFSQFTGEPVFAGMSPPGLDIPGASSYWSYQNFPMIGVQVAQFRTCGHYLVVETYLSFEGNPMYEKSVFIEEGDGDLGGLAPVTIDIPASLTNLGSYFDAARGGYVPYMGRIRTAFSEITWPEFKAQHNVP